MSTNDQAIVFFSTSVTRFHFLNQFPKVKTTRFIAKNIYKIFNNISARFTLPAILKSGQPRAGPSRQFREMTCFGAKSQERRCSWRSQRPANNIHEHYSVRQKYVSFNYPRRRNHHYQQFSTDISSHTAPKSTDQNNLRCKSWRREVSHAGRTQVCVASRLCSRLEKGNRPIKGTRISSTIDWSDIGDSAHHQRSGRHTNNRLQITLLGRTSSGSMGGELEIT